MKQIIIALTILVVAAAQAEAEKYALLVGVEKYNPDQLTTLQFAEDDVLAVGMKLQQLDYQVKVMHSAAIPALNPINRSNIETEIRRHLADKGVDDTVVLVLSGHGLQFKNDPLKDGQVKEFYFCPADATLSDRKTLLPMSFINEQVSKCAAARKLLLFDACRDEVVPKDFQAKAASAIELDPVGITRREFPQGALTIFSCSPTQRSFESAKLNHGVFTYHLLEYLDGKSRRAKYFEEQMTVNELAASVSGATKDYVNQTLNKDQIPQSVGVSNDWVIGRIKIAGQPSEDDDDDDDVTVTYAPAPKNAQTFKAKTFCAGQRFAGGKILTAVYQFRPGDVAYADGSAIIRGTKHYTVLTPQGTVVVPASEFEKTQAAATVPAGPRIVEIGNLPAWYDKYLVDYAIVPEEKRKAATRVPARDFIGQFLLSSECQNQWGNLWNSGPPSCQAVRAFVKENNIRMHAGHQKKYAYQDGYIYDAVDVQVIRKSE